MSLAEIVKLTVGATRNALETAADVPGDVLFARNNPTGMARIDLFRRCMNGADADREDGWREYVDGVFQAANQITATIDDATIPLAERLAYVAKAAKAGVLTPSERRRFSADLVGL